MTHEWRSSGCGYDPADYCVHCGANSYESFGTLYCEDYRQAVIVSREKQERRHAPTEAAWKKARSVLTKEEWELMELRFRCGREYREVDRLII